MEPTLGGCDKDIDDPEEPGNGMKSPGDDDSEDTNS